MGHQRIRRRTNNPPSSVRLVRRPPVHVLIAAGTKEEILPYKEGKGRERERGERDINSILESINNVPGENRKWMETMEGRTREERKEKRQIEDGLGWVRGGRRCRHFRRHFHSCSIRLILIG